MSQRLKLSEPQQYVLQILMNRCVIDQTDFKKIYNRALTKFNMNDSENELSKKEVYSQFIRNINEAVKHYNFEIQKGYCEITGITFYCFIRQFDTCSIGKLSECYKPVDLKIFQIILTMIINSEAGYVNYNDLINQINDDFDEMISDAQTQSQSITKVPSNRVIRSTIEMFKSHYWLLEVVEKKNMVTLHGRALIELFQYITELFDEKNLNYCVRCKKLVLIGIKCGGENCGKLMHRYCAKEMFTGHKSCLSCNKKFTDETITSLATAIRAAKAAYQGKNNL